MSKKLKRIIIALLIICILVPCLVLSSSFLYLWSLYNCVNSDIVMRFREVYRSELTFDEFCDYNDVYQIEIDIDNTRLLLYLTKEEGSWNGHISHYEHYSDLIGRIPVYIENSELVICSDKPKRVSFTKLNLYRSFDADELSINRAFSDSFDYPLEEIRGTYPAENIIEYAQILYDELFSNLNTFNKEADYFKSIEKLKSVVYIRNLMNKDYPGHSLYFGFNGNDISK